MRTIDFDVLTKSSAAVKEKLIYLYCQKRLFGKIRKKNRTKDKSELILDRARDTAKKYPIKIVNKNTIIIENFFSPVQKSSKSSILKNRT